MASFNKKHVSFSPVMVDRGVSPMDEGGSDGSTTVSIALRDPTQLFKTQLDHLAEVFPPSWLEGTPLSVQWKLADVNSGGVRKSSDMPVHRAARYGDLGSLSMFRQLGFRYDDTGNESRTTPLMEACQSGRFGSAMTILQTDDGIASADFRDGDGNSALHYAVQLEGVANEREGLSRVLLTLGVSMFAPNREGLSALDTVLARGDIRLFQVFEEACGDINCLIEKPRSRTQMTVLGLSVQGANLPVLHHLLARQDVKGGLETRMKLSVKGPKEKNMLAHLSDEITSISGDMTALGVAVSKNDFEGAEALLAAGADANATIRLTNGKVFSQLQVAVVLLNPVMVDLLLKHGADPDVFSPGTQPPIVEALFLDQHQSAANLLAKDCNLSLKFDGKSISDIKNMPAFEHMTYLFPGTANPLVF